MAEIKIENREETEKVETGSKKPKDKEPGKEPVKKAKKKKAASIKDLEEKLAAMEREAKENYDRFLRVSAEFENYKKRSNREMGDFRKYANESIIKELLPVIDNLERALNLSAGDNGSKADILEGVKLTLKEILKVLEKFNVRPIESVDQVFDPNFHQAVMQKESGDHPEQTVIEELQKGYMIHDRLLRAAMVVVSK
jgi:molecular chaperone GrpE